MKKFTVFLLAIVAYSFSFLPQVAAEEKSGPARFEKGFQEFGVEIGWGAGVNIPSGRDRTDIQFVHLAANFKRDLTGTIAQSSFFQGNLNWMVELNADLLHNPAFGSLVGFSPFMLQYKFVKPERKWAPTIMGGAGFALTNWDEKDLAYQEISGDFQFLLHGGVGLEFFRPKGGSYSINYRFYHVSNAGMSVPNIGLNANLFTLGFNF